MLKEKRIIRANQIIQGFARTISNIPLSNSFNETVEKIITCKGKILTLGIGKAGIAMCKFSSTLCSFGFPSCFLHPVEALHGDMGLIGTDDILFVASNSGKTREILEFIKLAGKNNCIIGITSHIDSPIRERADIVIDMGKIVEEGELKIAPTSSILVMLAITDSLALVAAEEKGLTLEGYGINHHAWYLGALARNDNNIY